MEYLMTYGWAILIIAIVLVAFFSLNLFNPYTFSPKASPGSCQILRPNGPGSNLFVSAVGPTCTTDEIPQYVASISNTPNSRIIVSPSQSIDTTWGGGPWTITAWFKDTSLPGSTLTTIIEANGCISGSTLSGSGSTYAAGLNQWYQQISASGSSACNAVGGVGTYTPYVLVLDKWYMLTAESQLSGTNLITTACYNNQCTTANTVLPNGYMVENYVQYGGPELIFGEYCCALPYYAGQITNIQIYNTSLSSSAINTLYAEGIGGAPVDIQNLVGWWPLNGNSNDYSGNGNNGVPTNVVFTSNWESGYSAP